MTPAACTTAVLAVLLAGSSTAEAQSRDYKGQSLDLLRLLADKPWMGLGPHNRWDRPPHIESELANGYDPRIHPHINLDSQPHAMDSDEDNSNYVDDDLRLNSEKRSAVATALNSGRRRRQPTPALGVLNDVGSFFDSLRDNLEALASLSPQQRSNLFQDPPNVVHAPSSGGGGGGTGMRRLHALRPLRPTGNIRSYNRRSFVEADGTYPGANHHDPGLLWTGLGR
ncbi:uncharacterized protein LOC114355368 isoform X5 [Ostrinia furnacalis]|uniref:uncharacterized protein LOC114355368 isoform X5 n=1 Tax=Ostrinia furnacalis TaxID=93504 RepID=UPI00103F26C3|nr:uncharacterized protein LOC114355368 isoform X5 [Ostrinia furnacalis]